ncbi:hypothetical protein PAXRUDRAFT_834581 [Paxillus rubicundulus Ve08.2h10]|uniref:Uncharacterized protein n=1 Tax=Paxillus rubicundulus Ve08.2h10 TaxID=930991 RepID=A0A0D0CSQ6_9AGAM|nr:hypothetical protein PAXRUDRAFT_834581 [Paxillus rubicundulus Ve08.2h10]
MKTFLTLLAAITFLSAHTHVGVHAACAICPSVMGGMNLAEECTQTTTDGFTTCQYLKSKSLPFRFCQFDTVGAILKGGDPSCPHRVKTSVQCHPCY